MRVLSRFAGIGDALFVNTIASHLAQQIGKKVWVASNYPSIFKNNPHIRMLPFKSRKYLDLFLAIIRRLGISVKHTYMDYGNPTDQHIFEVLAYKTGLKKALKMPLYFGPVSKIKKAGNRIAIQSAGNETWTSNKSYDLKKWEAISAELSKNYLVYQVGLSSDPLLPEVIDKRGAHNITEAISFLSEMDLFVGTVGFLMHAAAAVGTPSVIVYGGFESPNQSGYTVNSNLFSDIHCSPCWTEICPYNKECMTMIEPNTVVEAVNKQF